MPTSTMRRAHDEAMGNDGPTLPGKPARRIFTAEYKLAIIAEYEACTGTGEKGALLRREGLYSSHLVEWRKARDAGAIGRLSAQPRKRRGSKSASTTTAPPTLGLSDGAALAKANRRITKLEADLARARLVIDIQGKAHALLEMLAESADTEPKPKP